MQEYGGENYIAELPASFGDEVSYYIHAADESGRSENLPYIGVADPFVFTVADGVFLTVTPDTVLVYEEPQLTIFNTSNGSVDIQNIVEQDGYSEYWFIDHTVPEISEYPYVLESGESIVVYLAALLSKTIFYDSLLVVTEDSTYFSIVTGDYVLAEELSNENTQVLTYPNPITNRGEISFSLQQSAAVELSIYNVQGQLIKTIEASRLTSGLYTYTWDGENHNGQDSEKGIYLVYLQIDNQVITKKWVKM